MQCATSNDCLNQLEYTHMRSAQTHKHTLTLAKCAKQHTLNHLLRAYLPLFSPVSSSAFAATVFVVFVFVVVVVACIFRSIQLWNKSESMCDFLCCAFATYTDTLSQNMYSTFHAITEPIQITDF